MAKKTVKSKRRITSYKRLISSAHKRLIRVAKSNIDHYLARLPRKITDMLDQKVEEYFYPGYNKQIDHAIVDIIQEEIGTKERIDILKKAIDRYFNRKVYAFVADRLEHIISDKINNDLGVIVDGKVGDITKNFCDAVKELPKVTIDEDFDISDPKSTDSPLGNLILRMLARKITDLDE